jgi:hypothetical protein
MYVCFALVRCCGLEIGGRFGLVGRMGASGSAVVDRSGVDAFTCIAGTLRIGRYEMDLEHVK